MGRPKGSRNKKNKKVRKYTRRKQHNGLVPYPPEDAQKVLDLVGEVKDRLMRANTDTAREAIPLLLDELTWLSKLIDHPAP